MGKLKQVQGFTLLELIIVLVISVLGFAAISGNINSGNQTTKLQALARDISSALRYAQGEALLTRQPVYVAINLDDNTYRISNRNKTFSFAKEIVVSVTVAQKAFANGEGAIFFFADGSSTGGKINLEWGNQVRRLQINWITGAVTLSDNN